MIFRKKPPTHRTYQLSKINRSLQPKVPITRLSLTELNTIHEEHIRSENPELFITSEEPLETVNTASHVHIIASFVHLFRIPVLGHSISSNGITLPHSSLNHATDNDQQAQTDKNTDDEEDKPSIMHRFKAWRAKHHVIQSLSKAAKATAVSVKATVKPKKTVSKPAPKAPKKKGTDKKPKAKPKKNQGVKSVRIPKFNSVKIRLGLSKVTSRLRGLTWGHGVLALIILSVVAAQVALQLNILLGVYAVAVSLVILTVIAIRWVAYRTTAISVAVLQTATLAILCIPQQNYFVQTVIFYAVLLVLTLIYRYLYTLDTPSPKTALGKSPYFALVILIPAMIIVGQIFGIWQYFALHSSFPFKDITPALLATVFILFAIIEEMYYRGLVQSVAIREMGVTESVLLSMTLYSISFLNHATPWTPIIGLAFGLFLGLVYVFRQNTVLTIAANITAKLLFIWLIVAFVL